MPEEVETSWRGKVGGMTEEEMERFLEYGVTMHLACLTPDGNPYMVVCWHEWRDGYFWVVPRQRSEWGRHL
ncbi:MAG TPA: hypothetical protein VGJ77_19455, partial [Gaiellaceae bacterium]